MAIVSTVIAMEPTYLPYERPPDPAALWTAIPRGLRGFIAPDNLVDAKPVNDVQTLSLTGTLPANFAYVFASISLRVSQNRMGDWDSNYHLNLQNWYQGTLAVSSSWVFSFPTVGPKAGSEDERSNGFQAIDLTPRAPMWAPNGTSGILINITAFNDTATVATAGTCSAFINFWEFDLEQVRKYPINAPLPTHSR